MSFLALRTKFILGFSGMVLLVTLVLLLYIRSEFHLFMENELRKRGISIAYHLAESSITPIITENRVNLQTLLTDFTKNENDIKYIYIVTNRQEVLAHTFGDSFPNDLLKTDPQPTHGTKHIAQRLQTEEEVIEDITAPIRQGALGRVHVGMSTQVIQRNLRHLLMHLLPFVVGILGLGILGAYLFAASITRPLSRLAKAAAQIGEGKRDVTVTISSRDEIGELAHSFNRMSTELAAQQQQLEALNQSLEERIAVALADLRQRDQALVVQSRLAAMGEMIDSIAHQWRQPLNNIGLIIQTIQALSRDNGISRDELEQDLSNAMEIIYFMSHTIDDFRNFFRQDKESLPFSVNDAVSRAVAFVTPSLRNRGIALELDEQPGISAEGYVNEYSQVILNIICNAKDVFSEREIQNPLIRLSITAEGGHSVVIIQDNGGGIDPAILPQIFDPYFSTKHEAHGTGIGLYMSRVIIEQNMAGRLSACNVEGGAEFRIEL